MTICRMPRKRRGEARICASRVASTACPSLRSANPTMPAQGRARTTEALYTFSRKLAGVTTLDDALWAMAFQIASMLKLRVVLLLPDPDGALAALLKSGRPDTAVVEELFLAAVARRPTAAEVGAITKAIAAAPSREEGFQDVLWALLNSKEFMFNH